MDLSPQGYPARRGQVSAHLHKVEPYIKPWNLHELVRGELKFTGQINGPVDDPATDGVNIEGQLVPEIESLRFHWMR